MSGHEVADLCCSGAIERHFHDRSSSELAAGRPANGIARPSAQSHHARNKFRRRAR